MRLYLRRLSVLLCALAAFFAIHTAYATSPADYSMDAPENLVAEHLYCESALLVDAQTGEILFTNNSRVRMYPASTTKIATLYVGLQSGIDLDEVITVPDEAKDIASGSSVIPVKPGDKLTYRDLLYSFMMTSGNDGANTIAVLTSGSITAFVEKMNAWVNEIGCVGTHFTNAHGLHDDEHYTTAQDLALMTRVAMENETFRDIVACAKYDMVIRRNGENINRTVETRNTLLIPDQKYYYRDCIGVKTGHTGKAGYCFVGAAERDGMRVISVVLNCPEDHHKWYDSAKLFEYGFTCYEDIGIEMLFEAVKDEIATIHVDKAIDTDVNGGYLPLDLVQISDADFSVKAVSENDVSRQFVIEAFESNAQIMLPESIEAPVAQGDVLGRLSYTSDMGQSVTAQLVASRSIERQPDPTPTPEPTREPLIYFEDDDGRIGRIISILLILLVAVLILTVILSLVSAARKRKRRRMIEKRRREQMRRRAANASRRPSGRGTSDPRKRY